MWRHAVPGSDPVAGAGLGMLLLAFVLAGCGGGGSPARPTPIPPPPEPPSADQTSFRVATLLSASRVPAAGDVERVFARANDILFQKTGERMVRTDLVNVGPGSPVSQAEQYANAHRTAPPDGVLVFSDDSTATTYGGYSQNFLLPSPNVNRFPSPVVGDNRGYVSVVDFFHRYARCGYDDAGNRIGEISSGGECRNRSGLACVDNGRYWMCPDARTDLYADLDYFTACSVVHEFMHPFGSEGNFDHYGTSQCVSRTAMSQADAQSLPLFQQSCGMCPDVYGRFRRR